MTALKGYDRLEAAGIWRATPDAQRRDVIVSLGDATLVIMDMRNQALAHWSIPAVERANPGHMPAIYHPDGDPGERLELPEDETAMIEAIDTLRREIERRRPHPGRLRLGIGLAVAAGFTALSVFWLPGALRQHTVSVVPDVKRVEIGEALLARITRVTGPRCTDPLGTPALARLRARLFPDGGDARLWVVPGGPTLSVHVPGGTILLNRALVEDYEDPAVAAGYAIVEHVRAAQSDPLADLLATAGLLTSVQLLTTGKLSDAALDQYAETLMAAPAAQVADDMVLGAFAEQGVPTTPYAYAIDISGENSLNLIEADPFATALPPPLISDGDWISLQGICDS